MKKWFVFIILFGMIGWVLYDNSEWQSKQTTKSAPESTDAEVGLKEGNIAPDFTLDNLDGGEMSLSDFHGQKVFINFWATWCPPCRAEMPHMQELYEEEDIEILAINLTETEPDVEQVNRFRNDFDLTFPILLDHDVSIAELYQIQPIPTSYFIDSNGRVHSVALGALTKEMMVQRIEEMD
ncbi:redoxin domain-containing protein [Alkalihalophilus sp. As8PL]|uniref:Redoxin domain-containing protein n=1 Tax=Alkalihalophilus sp. As8PL TaxID=3237103 RepID=A0AB39BUT4_9BACI